MISLYVRYRGSRASDVINALIQRLPYRRENKRRFLDLFLLLRLISVDATLAITYKSFEFIVDVHGLFAVLHQASDSDVQIVLAFKFAVDRSLHLNVFPHTPSATLNRFLRAPAFLLRVFALLACVEISLAPDSVCCELHTGLAAAQNVAF